MRSICPIGKPYGTISKKKLLKYPLLSSGRAKKHIAMTKKDKSQMARKIIREWNVAWGLREKKESIGLGNLCALQTYSKVIESSITLLIEYFFPIR